MLKIGLFPLKFVLFPESSVPLHIFEERYKMLINDCMSTKALFGINLNDSSKLYDVGCAAEIVNLVKMYDDGRMDIIIRGMQRYKLNHFNESERLYYLGEINFIDELKEEIDRTLLKRCLKQYNQIVTSLKDIHLEKLSIKNLQTSMPSYLIAQKSGLTIHQRQELLELTSENTRLEMLDYHLSKVVPLAKEAEMVTRIIQNDGYFRF